jgi:hypothetical protein
MTIFLIFLIYIPAPETDVSFVSLPCAASMANEGIKARFDQIVAMNHSLAKLGQLIGGSWKPRLGAAYGDGPGLPARFYARWLENPYFQLFCGEAGD